MRVGSEVRWREEIYRSPWRGKVTGRPSPGIVEIDGRGWLVSEGLLEVMVEGDDGMQTLVFEQCELISSLQDDCAALSELRERAFALVKALTGSYRPSPEDCLRLPGGRELLALSDELGEPHE